MDMLARFLPRFATLARNRIKRAVAIASAPDAAGAKSVAGEMHSLAGEAGMLGLESVLRAARDAEGAALRFAVEGGATAPLSEALRRLEVAIADVTRGIP
jgi:hypothetical protein